MADFKDEYSPALVEALGAEVAAAWPDFDMAGWTEHATSGLDDFELRARVGHLADELARLLPPEFETTAALLWRLLDSESFTGWMTWPVTELVATFGIDHPDVALPLLAGMTPRFSSEFAVRPFIQVHGELTFGYLHEWSSDPDEHVRRLVSESTRPRLPWASRLRELVADPSPTIPLLDRLFDDESDYVRRSVANHLNDISKDHPDLAIEIARRWLGESTHGDGVVRHALRTLVKKGHPDALALMGFDPDHDVELIDIACHPPTIHIGEHTTLSFELSATTETKVMVDYIVHYQGASGPRSGKVFKLTTRTLPAGESVPFEKRHRFAHVSIRRLHPGPHRMEVQVNGRVLGSTILDLLPES